MTEEEYRKELAEKRAFYWNEAGKGGAVIGGILSLSMIFTYLFRNTGNTAGLVSNLIVLFTMTVGVYLWGRRFAVRQPAGELPLTYLRIFSFLLTTLCFAGILYGATLYVLYTHVNTEYYQQLLRSAFTEMKLPEAEIKDYIAMVDQGITNPINILLNSIFSMYCIGLIPCAVIAALIRRR